MEHSEWYSMCMNGFEHLKCIYRMLQTKWADFYLSLILHVCIKLLSVSHPFEPSFVECECVSLY